MKGDKPIKSIIIEYGTTKLDKHYVDVRGAIEFRVTAADPWRVVASAKAHFERIQIRAFLEQPAPLSTEAQNLLNAGFEDVRANRVSKGRTKRGTIS